MPTFKDNRGREWLVKVNHLSAERVKDRCGFDLLSGDMQKLVTDPMLLCRVVYLLCEPQIEKASVTPEDFADALAGDPIDGATDALLESVVDFFPRARREAMKKGLANYRAALAQAEAMVLRVVDSPEMQAAVQARLDRLGSSAMNTLASSASIPGPSPSGG